MTNTTPYHIEIPEELAGKRLDAALAQLLAEHSLSRARIQQLLADGHITLDGPLGSEVMTKANRPVKTDEVYTVIVPAAVAAEPVAQAIALNVVYEDADLLVIDKPAGMVVHPAVGNLDGTLVNALLAHCGDSLSGIGGVKRPGIVHRLDKDTSGLMVVAKNDAAHQKLAAQFAAHENGEKELSRTYHAIVHGMAPASLTITTHFGRDPNHRQRMAVLPPGGYGGKHAVTHMQSLQHFGSTATLVSCILETGRTHQIRVHMQHVGHPVAGDPLYGKKRALSGMNPDLRHFPRQALHAAELAFIHPTSGKRLKFYSPLPHDMELLQRTLKKL